jgi:hypothetical protein
MADNEHVIVGASKVVCVVKLPSSLPGDPQDEQFVTHLEMVGQHDGQLVVLLSVDDVARLRKLGAEVTMIDNTGNGYAARVRTAASPADLVASIEKSVAKGKADLAIAMQGDGGNNDGKA